MSLRPRLVAVLVVSVAIVGLVAVLGGADHERVPPPDIDDEDDAAVVAQSIRSLHTEDYRLSIRWGWRENRSAQPEWEPMMTGRIQNSAERSYTEHHATENIHYVSGPLRWSRAPGTEWRHTRTSAWDPERTNPLANPDRVENADVERVGVEGGVVVYRIADTETIAAVHGAFPEEDYDHATALEFELDRDTGHLVTARLLMDEPGVDPFVAETRMADHGEVTVEEPEGELPLSVRERIRAVLVGLF